MFYPTSGGQQNDIGTLSIEGERYDVVDCQKAGHCVLHFLDREVLQTDQELVGKAVQGFVDETRRNELTIHHTAAHIVFASSRRVLGPHVWQNSSNTTNSQAHLDITHYASLTKEEIIKIQDGANRIVMSGKNINKSLMPKSEAEKQFGFTLYQGGIVPGNELRVVDIDGTDVEACCGTHCDNTTEVGWIKILATKRIADGIVRLYFVAGERAIDCLNAETHVINDLSEMWGITLNEIVPTASRFFNRYKKFKGDIEDQKKAMLALQVRYACDSEKLRKVVYASSQPNSTLYFRNLDSKAALIKVSYIFS